MTLNDMSFYENGFITNSHIQRKDTKKLKSVSSNKSGPLERSKFFTKYLKSLSNGSPLIDESSGKNRGLLKRSSYEFPYHFLQ